MFRQFPLDFYIFTSTRQGFLEYEVKPFQVSRGHMDPQSHLWVFLLNQVNSLGEKEPMD